jgi:membrane protease YdiL (CAAX protease family)
VDSRLKTFAVLSLIFVLNDFALIPVRSYAGWLAVDYLTRILAFAVIIYAVRKGACRWPDFGLKPMRAAPFIAWTAALTVACILIDQFGWKFFRSVLPPAALFDFPKADNGIVKIADLTAGLVLVSVSEEMIFRGLAASALSGKFRPGAIVAVSCVIFGLIHWSSGLHAVVTTAIWGILPMVSVLRTGSIYPALVAHWATDFIYFLQ